MGIHLQRGQEGSRQALGGLSPRRAGVVMGGPKGKEVSDPGGKPRVGGHTQHLGARPASCARPVAHTPRVTHTPLCPLGTLGILAVRLAHQSGHRLTVSRTAVEVYWCSEENT